MAVSSGLSIDSLSAGYGGHAVITGVSLSVARGECVAILGDNGSGKSTILKAVAGLAEVLTGEVRLGNQVISASAVTSNQTGPVAYVPQGLGVFGDLSVFENIDVGMPSALRSQMRRLRIGEVCQVVPMLKPLLNRQGWSLSGGEQRAVAVARALVRQPDVLLLDEPLAGLAAHSAELVIKLVRRAIAMTQCVCLIVEHRDRDVIAVADWAVVLAEGKVVAAGWPETLQPV